MIPNIKHVTQHNALAMQDLDANGRSNKMLFLTCNNTLRKNGWVLQIREDCHQYFSSRQKAERSLKAFLNI